MALIFQIFFFSKQSKTSLPTGQPVVRAAAFQCDVTASERGGGLRQPAGGQVAAAAGPGGLEGAELEVRAGQRPREQAAQREERSVRTGPC